MTEDEMVGWHPDSMDVSLSKPQELVMEWIGMSGMQLFTGVTKSRTQVSN